MIKDIHTQKHILGYLLELSITGQYTMARVTQNGDLKEREKEKVHERNIHLGEFVSYAILTLALPQTAALMVQNMMM